MSNGQKTYLTVFAIAIFLTFYQFEHLLRSHCCWIDFTTTEGVADLFATAGSVVGMVLAALGVNVGEIVNSFKKDNKQ